MNARVIEFVSLEPILLVKLKNVSALFLFLFLLEVEVINFTNHKDPDSPS